MASTRRLRRTVSFGAVGALALAACSHDSTVRLLPPTPPAAAAAPCTALLAALDKPVGGLTKREVTPVSAFTRAWGDPAVTLRCGGPAPAADASDSLAIVNGLTWRVRTIGDVVQWEAEERSVGVEVRLPLANRSQEGVMSDVTEAVQAAIPVAAKPL